MVVFEGGLSCYFWEALGNGVVHKVSFVKCLFGVPFLHPNIAPENGCLEYDRFLLGPGPFSWDELLVSGGVDLNKRICFFPQSNTKTTSWFELKNDPTRVILDPTRVILSFFFGVEKKTMPFHQNKSSVQDKKQILFDVNTYH